MIYMVALAVEEIFEPRIGNLGAILARELPDAAHLNLMIVKERLGVRAAPPFDGEILFGTNAAKEWVRQRFPTGHAAQRL